MAKKLVFELPIVGSIEVVVSCDELAEFAKRQMAAYYKSSIDCDTNITGSQITIKNKKFLTQIAKFFNQNATLARLYQVQDNSICFDKLKYEFTQNQLVINYRFHEKKKWFRRKRKPGYAQCHPRFYNQILFPIFSLYTLYDGYYLVHGSLIYHKNKNIIISGLDGVGKSSMSNLFIQHKAKIYSDNFVLFNGKTAIPFNLAIRLEPDKPTTMQELYRNHELKEVLSPDISNDILEIDEIIVLSIGEKLVLSDAGNNLSALLLFSNNAPEIKSANTIIAPFLYLHTVKDRNTNITIRNLSVPMGGLDKAMELLENEH